jgi:hypothetical protein
MSIWVYIGFYLLFGIFLADTFLYGDSEQYWWVVALFYPLIALYFFVMWIREAGTYYLYRFLDWLQFLKI